MSVGRSSFVTVASTFLTTARGSGFGVGAFSVTSAILVTTSSTGVTRVCVAVGVRSLKVVSVMSAKDVACLLIGSGETVGLGLGGIVVSVASGARLTLDFRAALAPATVLRLDGAFLVGDPVSASRATLSGGEKICGGFSVEVSTVWALRPTAALRGVVAAGAALLVVLRRGGASKLFASSGVNSSSSSR